MHHRVLKFSASLIIIIQILYCDAIGISSKLDFSEGKLIASPIKRKHVSPEFHEATETNKVGIICKQAEGCNVTHSTESSQDAIEADVVVHVKTNVDLGMKRKSNEEEEKIPDIPVILGTPSSNEDRNTVIDRFDRPFPVSVDPNRYAPPVLSTQDLLKARTEQTINVKIEPLSLNGDKRNKAYEVHLPYFEAAYHRHYFGENPPPQVVWLPKGSNDFKGRPALVGTTPLQHSHGAGIACSCKNEVAKGLQWYPSNRRFSGGIHIDDKLAPLN